jgi:hypothetical protein
MKVYVAGGMSGYPQSNFPAFYEAAESLRANGFDVVSPAELDDADTVRRALANEPAKQSWGDFLARDVKLLADTGIEGIVFLPGWEKSKGAKLEAFVGLLGNLKFFAYSKDSHVAYPVQRDDVLFCVYQEMRK